MDVIFSDYGIETKKEDERYYLNYDEGELVPEFRTIEISYAKVEKAMLGPEDAYEVIIAFQNRGGGNNGERSDHRNQGYRANWGCYYLSLSD